MMDDILKASNLYAEGLKHVRARRDAWLKKHKELKTHLMEVADYLDAHTEYKQDFYVDSLMAFSEDINGTCSAMPSISFRSGRMPMLVTFRNNIGERKEFDEDGFSITFTPLITGQLVVMLAPHQSDLNKIEQSFATLAVIDDPEQLTMEIADQIIAKGIEAAWYTSFTGLAERQDQEDEEEQKRLPRAQTPIGFKRYETTEQVK